jgi:hypothetical protein
LSEKFNILLCEFNDSKIFNDYCKKYGHSDHQELKSEVLTILLELPQHKKDTIAENNYLTPYALQILKFQVSHSNWTAFRKKFGNREKLIMFDDINIHSSLGDRGGNDNEITDRFIAWKKLFDVPMYDLHDIEEVEIEVEKVVAKIEEDMLDQNNKYFYHSRLLNELIITGVNTKQLSRDIGIPYTSVRHAIKEYRLHLKEWLK